jgi:hypothetical protein
MLLMLSKIYDHRRKTDRKSNQMKNNIQEILNDCKWHAEAPASEEVLKQLLQRSSLPLPADYLDLLRCSNGGQGFLTVQPYLFRLWPAEQAVDNNLDYQMPDYVPGFFGFGDDGGDEFFALDTQWKIYSIPFLPMEESAARLVAENILSLINYLESDSAEA